MSAKNFIVVTLDGREFRRTAKKARELFAKGNHRWQGEFTLVELRPDSSHPDYSRLLTASGLHARVASYRRTRYIPEKMPPVNVPNTKFMPPTPVAWELQYPGMAFMQSLCEGR